MGDITSQRHLVNNHLNESMRFAIRQSLKRQNCYPRLAMSNNSEALLCNEKTPVFKVAAFKELSIWSEIISNNPSHLLNKTIPSIDGSTATADTRLLTSPTSVHFSRMAGSNNPSSQHVRLFNAYMTAWIQDAGIYSHRCTVIA